MSTSVSSVVSHFPSAENGFTTTLASTVSAGATTVPLNSVAGFTNGEIVVFVVDPSNESKKQTFTGTIDTSGVQVTDVVWTAGTNVDHTAGATVVDYASATHISMMTKGILVHANQDGTLKTSTVQDALGVTTLPSGGWDVLNGGTAPTVGTGKTLGNRSFDLTFSSVDLSSTLSPGMRIKLDRNTTPSTQCADFESSSSQYASKSSPSGISFTTTFSAEAWVKLESYSGATNGIVARRNADTAGWSFDINSAGRVTLTGLRIASNNKLIRAYQSLPLNKWVHVAATMDMSAGDTSAQKIWIDGVEVPREYSLTGTASALVQGTVDLTVGASKSDGSLNMDGEISDVRVWSDNRTDTEIKDNMYQALVGNETNLVGYWKLDGDFTDETSNSNDLTASGGVVATTVDNPFNATEYGVITSVSYSTNTTVNVFCPEGYGIPNETLTNPFYSTQSTPFGFPRERSKWEIICTPGGDVNAGGSWASTGIETVIPIGSWKLSMSSTLQITCSGANYTMLRTALSSSSSGTTDYELISTLSNPTVSSLSSNITTQHYVDKNIDLSSATTYYQLAYRTGGLTATVKGNSTNHSNYIKAECAYI